IDSPFITKAGIALSKAVLALGLPVKEIFRKTLFKQFCGGATLEEAGSTAETLRRYNVHAILDYGVEQKDTDADFEKTALSLANAVTYAAAHKIPFVSIKVTGIARFALLEKIHQKIELSNAEKLEW